MYTNSTRSEIKIADWGLGKDINKESLALTAASGGQIGGTPGYCSPEQWFALDKLVDDRADIYSLGTKVMVTARKLKVKFTTGLKKTLMKNVPEPIFAKLLIYCFTFYQQFVT
jgi:serine/threonine protein kinase